MAFAAKRSHTRAVVIAVAVVAALAAGEYHPRVPAGPAVSQPAVSQPAVSQPAVWHAGGSPAAAPAARAESAPARPGKLLIIAEENHTYEQVIGSPAAPYLNRLARAYGSATAMDAGYPTRCPSLAAYILMTSGDTNSICDDKAPKHHHIDGNNIFAQVDTAGLSWRDYAESAPEPCARTNTADGVFLVRHTPAPYYTSEAARCPSNDIPAGTPSRGALRDDIASGHLPDYGYVSPDACHDMHGAHPSCESQLEQAGDTWLSEWVPQILAGPDYTAGRLVVIITWDEGSPTSNHIPTLVLSPATHAISSGAPYTHCSVLATAEDLLRLPRIACAAGATSFNGAFHLPTG